MKLVLVAAVLGAVEPPVEEFPPPADADVQMAPASEPAAPEELPIREAETTHETPWYVARYDYGGEGLHRYGFGYHPWGAWKSGQGPAVAWWSVGPEVLFTTRRHRRMESGELAFRGRTGMIGHAGLGVRDLASPWKRQCPWRRGDRLHAGGPHWDRGVPRERCRHRGGHHGAGPGHEASRLDARTVVGGRLHIPESWPH